MKTIACGFTAIVLAALMSGCGFSEHTYAVQEPPTVAPSAAYTYSNGYYYYPSTGTYVRAY
jgi:hypothetical protein